MGVKAQNQFSPEWFTPTADDAAEADEPGEVAARFKVRGLTGSQQAEVMPECGISDDGGDLGISGRAMALLLKFGLLDWDNFEDENGPVRFSKVARVNQDYLTYPTQVQLAGKIFELTFPVEEDKKKSPSPPK